MDSITKIQHAYVVAGGGAEALVPIKAYLEKEWGVAFQGNPDVYYEKFETLGVDDARRLKALAETRAFGTEKFIFIEVKFLGIEAQNALLKTLEEPAEGTYLFLFVEQGDSVLPTILSRALLITIKTKEGGDTEATTFLKSSPEVRLKYLSTLLSDESESKKSDLLTLLNNLELVLSQKKKTKEVVAGLTELLLFKKYLFDRSPSIKMIAEFLALKIPVTAE